MQWSASGLLFLAAAFPFVIPLIPSTDTQPTFTLVVAAFAVLAAAASFERPAPVRRSDLMLAVAITAGGVIWLALSFAANGFQAGSMNRVVSFIMLLIAVTVGLLNRHIFTRAGVSLALKLYVAFTGIFFVTRGAIERVVIQSRDDEALANLVGSGRGASTLSPEPSFFAFQIFTLFLAARLTVWSQFSSRERHATQLITILLLLASLGGYGILYAAIVVMLSGWRYIVAGAIAGAVGLIVLINSLGIDSLRFISLFTTLFADFGSGRVSDISTLGRLNSFMEYIRAFDAQPWFGDAFAVYSGGGLVSILAAVGLFGVVLNLLFLIAIFALRERLHVKLALLAWFALQFISGPVGLPFVGLLIGVVIGKSRLGTILDAARLAPHRAAEPRPT